MRESGPFGAREEDEEVRERSCSGKVCAVTFAIGALATTSSADLIPLVPGEVPDVLSTFLDIAYDADGAGLLGDFDITGVSSQLIPNNEDPVINGLNGGFELDAKIDPATGEAVEGSLSITGNIGNGFEVLLTGTLSDFGWLDNGGSLLEFTFDITGGVLAGDYLAYSPEVGVQVAWTNENNSYSGDWTEDFINDDVLATEANAFAIIPGPASLALFTIAGVFGPRRRRSIA